MGIAILLQILVNNGFSVAVVDASSENLSDEEAVKRILELNPKILGLTGMAQNSLSNKIVSEGIRKNRPDIIQITGGAWVNSVEEFILQNVSVDYIVTGEAEQIIVELVDTLLKTGKAPDVPGLSYLKDGEFITITPEKVTGRGFMYVPKKYFNELPFPAYSFFDMDFYTFETTPNDYIWFSAALPELRKKGKHNKKIKVGCILSGRGCFGKCDFCGAAQTARRNYSPEYVADNMTYMNREFGVDTFLFMESLTFASPKWVKYFCNLLIERKMDYNWIAISRGDFRYDEETLGLLKKSGCVAINIGFESGSNDMLANMHKEVTVEQYRKIYSDFTSHNITVFGQFVTNMPGETIHSLDETAHFVEDTKMLFSFGAAHPYADSKLFDWARDHGFCEVKDVLFSTENKGKFTKSEVQYYINRWNFNKFEFSDFYSQWRKLHRIKLKNTLIHRSRIIPEFILNLIPALLYDFSVTLITDIKLLTYYGGRIRNIIKAMGFMRGVKYIFRKAVLRISGSRVEQSSSQ